MLIVPGKNRVLKAALLTTAFLTFFAQDARADKITISGQTDYRAGAGGEFNIRAADAGGATLLSANLSTAYTTVNGTTVGTADGTLMNAGFGGLVGFQTFCIEFNEFINLDGTYDVAISNGSIYGGVAGGVDPDGAGPLPQSDTISIGTAYLYSLFATGTLSGYTYVNGSARAASALMLQEAFWYLEDEISLTAAQKTANIFLSGASGAITVFGDGTSGAKRDNDFALYHVQVLNLGGVAPNQKQDQLIMVPDGGFTLMMLGAGLSSLAVLRRKPR